MGIGEHWLEFAEKYGNTASILSLVFAILAVLAGGWAARAAQAARRAVLQRNLAEDVEALRRHAEQLVVLLQSERWDAAGLKAEELLGAVNEAKQRWPDLLDEESKTWFDDCRERVRQIGEGLDYADGEVDSVRRGRFLAHARSVMEVFSEVLGRVRSQGDRDTKG